MPEEQKQDSVKAVNDTFNLKLSSVDLSETSILEKRGVKFPVLKVIVAATEVEK